MSNTLKHKTLSGRPASTDPSKIDGPKWDAEHVFSGGALGDVLVRNTGQSDGASWSSAIASSTPALWFTYAAWGDSLTAGGGAQTPYTTPLAALVGQAVYQGGVGGETSTQIATRFLADTTHNSGFVIIWAGRNNYTDPTTVKADIAAMIAALGHTRYLVLSILNGEYTNEYSGQPGYVTMMQLNADLAALYPSNYLDVRSYLVSQFDPNNAQDVIDHGHDIVPSSLRIDTIHPTTAANVLIANYVYAWLVAHDLVGRRAARLSDVLAMFTTPPEFGAPIKAADGSSSAPSITSKSYPTSGLYFPNSSTVVALASGQEGFAWSAIALKLPVTGSLGWTSAGAGGSLDTVLVRDAANQIGQRNSTSPQALHLYETYINASNYGRLRFIARPGNGDYAIYTDVNGSPTARALSFGAAGALQWQITPSGHWLALTDNSFDIGASGATRPRDFFLGRNATVGGTLAVNGLASALADGAFRLWRTGSSGIPAQTFSKSAMVQLAGAGTVNTPPNIALLQIDLGSMLGGATDQGAGKIEFCSTRSTVAQVTAGTRAAVANTDYLGRIMWLGDDGTNLRTIGADISGLVDTGAQAVGTAVVPTQLRLRTFFQTAIVFSTNGTDRWSFTKDGHLQAASDNSFDIGTSGAARPRNVFIAGALTLPGGTLLQTSAALSNGAAAAAGTLTNAPTAGNPTKWIPINDNGTTRYIPAW